MLQKLVEFFHGAAFGKALAQQKNVKAAHRAYLRRNATEFAREMEQVKGKNITIGAHEASGRQVHVRVSLQNFLGHHLIQGRSGSGKSRYAESLILQLLLSFPEVGLVVIDGKGELSARMRLWIVALLSRMNDKDRERLLDRVVIIDLFDSSVIPPLNVCVPIPGYPVELIAEDVLGGLRRLFSEAQLTLRMERPLRNLLLAFIEAGRDGHPLSLLEANNFLADATFRDRVLAGVQNEEVKRYFARDFPGESRGTIEAIKARLEYLLVSEQMRLAFGANDSVHFLDALASGKIVFVNLGKTLLATDTAREVVGTLLLSSFVRSVFSRPMNSGPYIMTICDEFQNFILPGAFERLFTEARSFRCFVTAICQQLGAQLASRSLKDIIVNNVRYITLFSSNEEDARLLGRVMFRPTGCLPKPRRPFSNQNGQRFYTESEELELFIRSIPSLQKQHCYFWDKENRCGAQPIITCSVPEPHEFAGMREDELLHFGESLAPLWKRIGVEKEEAQRVIEDRRNHWGIGKEALQPSLVPQGRTGLLKKLKAQLGKGKE